MFKKVAVSVVISLTIAASYVLWRGTPTVATPEIAPTTIEASKPALVTVTVRIQDPTVNVHSVALVRVDAHAEVLTETEMLDEDGTNTDYVAGHRFFILMRDDGTKGDAVASDGVFTRRVALKESSGPVYFEVQAAFAKVERKVRSPLITVNVSQ